MNIKLIKPNKENLNTFVITGSFFILLGFWSVLVQVVLM